MNMSDESHERANITRYCHRLEDATDFQEIWKIVKDAVKDTLGQHRIGMMLFLDDLPLQVGAYHSVGTNNIVMNRALLEIIEASVTDTVSVNAFIFHILLHEYLHALGYLREREVTALIREISNKCFGPAHRAAQLAREGPWSMLRDVPIRSVHPPRRQRELIKDLDPPTQPYIV